jgi:L-asparaginase II
MHQVVAQVWRGQLAESEHHGSVVALDTTGALAFSVGQPDAVMFPRSALKPVQAVAMARCGLRLDDELLALAAASHPGEDFHIHGVRRILASAGLSPLDLRNTPDLPLDEASRFAAVSAGRVAEPLFQNCSGKHAAMLATCVINQWPLDTYLSPDHPLQKTTRVTVAQLCREPVSVVGVDGCGAPLFGVTLTGLARAFRSLALAARSTVEHRVASAVSSFPEWVGGTGRPVVRLMRAFPGAVAKDGAEAVLGVGLPCGRAVAIKIADGSHRALPVVAVAALRRLGITSDALDAFGDVPVLGHGARVGAIRPSDALVALT